MPTSLDQYMPYDAGPGADVTEIGWRSFMRRPIDTGIFSGIGGEFAVFADSTGMQVKVPTGEAWIQGHWGESQAQKTLAIATAPGTNTRKDRVILRNDFVNNRIELDVLTGTAAASPVVPSLTQDTTKWEIALATVTVGTSVSTITAGSVADERLLVGQIATVKRPSFKVVRTSDLSVSNTTDTIVTWQSASEDNATMWSAGSPTILTCKQAGLWLINSQVRWSNASGAGTRNSLILKNGTNVNTNSIANDVRAGSTAGGGPTCNYTVPIRLAIGDTLRLNVYQDSGGSLNVLLNYGGTYLSGVYLGP